jgi:DegV family protein with EDD domain
MSGIAVVTDSTAFIPARLVEEFEITVAPQVLIWGDQTYNDGVDIQPDEFYTRLKTASVMPTTSQVSVVTMQSIFEKLIAEGKEVLGIFISGKFSGTMQSAIQGREALGTASSKVTLVDSQASAMALGFQALAVARAARDGASIAEAKELAEKSTSHIGIYFAVDTLEFLHRGGRISGANAHGSALNLKPIIALRDGRIEAEDACAEVKSVDRVLELVTRDVQGKPTSVWRRYANAEAEPPSSDRASRQVGAIESVLASSARSWVPIRARERSGLRSWQGCEAHDNAYGHGGAVIIFMDRPRPLTIGIAGGSGSGKTTVAQEISGVGADRIAFLQHDLVLQGPQRSAPNPEGRPELRPSQFA